MRHVVVVGQTPPPLSGQAIMIERMLGAKWDGLTLHHVRMGFMTTMDQRGKFSLRKIFHLFEIIARILWLRVRTGATILYYPPCNAPKSAIYRDLIIVGTTRWFFKKLVFHFHAAGISETYPTLRPKEQRLARWIMRRPDLTITSSAFNPPDGPYLEGRRNAIVPLGIPDEFGSMERKPWSGGPLRILFIGLMNGTKGEGFLLEAVGELAGKGHECTIELAGTFQSPAYRAQFFERVQQLGLESKVEHLGLITGEAKRKAFQEADLFCFPSFFESESFGVVLLEAMQAGLPVVATRWRGIQSAVKHGETGILVATRDPKALAIALEQFLCDPVLLQRFGEAGRAYFLEQFQLSRHLEGLERELLNV
jgi:glycosyltransferase involved in cell wall biosynthesis